jgi:hypothetical protein
MAVPPTLDLERKSSMAYTYLIGWSNFDTYYYGVRFAKDCEPSELFNTYKTSSKHVKEFVKENGKPDIIQIRKVFSDAASARIWETKVLKRLRVVENSKWLNKTDNLSIDPEKALAGAKKTKNKGFTPWNKGKAGYKKRPARPMSEECKAKIIAAAAARRGIPLSEECKIKMRGPRGPQKNPCKKRRVPWNKGVSGYAKKKTLNAMNSPCLGIDF